MSSIFKIKKRNQLEGIVLFIFGHAISIKRLTTPTSTAHPLTVEMFSKNIGKEAKGLLRTMKIANRKQYDYKEFLRKFAVTREMMEVDEDSFDYGYYTYGLQLYQNMPLIEALEYKEVKRIEEFVIAIDTSGSCSGQLVKQFLEETVSILLDSESFLKKVNIHIIQCDDQIQTDQKITCEKELIEYMDNLELHGFGGTDFRPAFMHVDRMVKAQKFRSLKGLIYFTDGMGLYPQKRPPYDVAFVLLEEPPLSVKMPPWAIRLVLDTPALERTVKELDLTLDTDIEELPEL